MGFWLISYGFSGGEAFLIRRVLPTVFYGFLGFLGCSMRFLGNSLWCFCFDFS